MNLRDYLRTVRKRWRLVVSVVILAALIGVVFSLQTEKKYEATAQLFVSTAGAADDNNLQQLAQGNTLVQARVQSYTSLASSPVVTAAVLRCLPNIGLSQSELADEISADAPANKVLINITVVDRSPSEAAQLANAAATTFGNYVQRLEQTSGSQSLTTPLSCQQEASTTAASNSPVRLAVTRPAVTPSSPVTPNIPINVALALVIGVALGVAVAVARDLLDNTVKTPSDLEAVGGPPVLGVIPLDRGAADQAISFRADMHGGRAEAFRTLRTNLQFVDIDKPSRVIAVSSALPGEGKTHTCVNLAASLAEAGNRVCLVEADLRKPTVAKLLGLVPSVGLTSVLLGQAQFQDALQNAGRNFAVLTAGPVPPNPSELLVSHHFRRVLAEIAAEVDVLVVDTAPLLPVADGSEVAQLVDATVLVVRYGKTSRDQVRRACQQLANVGVQPAGAVLSMVPNGSSDGYETYYYSNYRPSTGSSSGEAGVPANDDTGDAEADDLAKAKSAAIESQ